tara:strand:- start:383 stop:487 length:105 start_codon:yes stop_codon:yes gene_type:complete
MSKKDLLPTGYAVVAYFNNKANKKFLETDYPRKP